MKIEFKQKIKLGIIIITSFFNTSAALANNIESIPAVSKLKNIHTRDWEYRALQSIAQRYNCTSQWQSNETSTPLRDWRSNAEGDRSNSPITRYEFAVGLNNCLQQIDTTTISQQDLIIVQRLQQDFAQELAQLTNKVAQVEANITQLESQQFSTTTKFNGQVLFFLTDSLGQEDSSQTTFGYRSRLYFDTSFYGQDLLRVRLESSDLGRLDDVTDTSLSRLSVDSDSDNQIEISELSYTFPTSDRTEILFGTAGVSLNDVGEVLNPFSSSSSGAVSRFGRRDPATLRAPGGSGIGIKQEFSDEIRGFAGYFINNEDVANPQVGRGLFDSSASAIAQLVIEPEDELAFAATYTRTYERSDDVNLMGSTGVEEANEPFGQNATTSNNFGLQANWEVTSGLEIGGWVGYTQAQQQQNGDASATILNGALTFAFPDLGAENNLGGIIIGVPPVISGHDDDNLITEDTPIHIEALYRIEVNDYIEITPGGFVILNPDTEDGNTLWVGTVRTEFSF
jgi:Carbohydrate-selective porin, OprB family